MKSMQDIVESIKDRAAAIDAKSAMENGLRWCRRKSVRIVEAAVVGCFAVALVSVGISANNGSEDTDAQSAAVVDAYSATAGVAGVLNGYELEYADKVDLLTIVDQDITVVGSTYADEADDSEVVQGDTESEEQVADTEAGGDSTDVSEDEAQTGDTAFENTSEAGIESDSSEADSETEVSEEPELTDEEKEWQQYLMADVDEYLYIRAEASEDSEAVGKLYKGDRAVIEETSGDWIKISSGSVTGYVNSEYCVTGTEALEYMKANCEMIATVISNKSLRVRKAPSTSSSIIKMVSKGTVLTVDTSAETDEGWVAVVVNGSTCYVCADYVEVSYDIGEAISIEEEKAAEEAAKAAEEAAKAAEEAAAASSSSSSNSYDISDEELTLLAALIQCEAGGESYKCQVSVGAVVMNRVASSKFPNSITKVIYQSGQFGPVSNGSLAKRLSSGPSSTAYKAAKEALAGIDYTDGCLYFNDIYHTSHSGLQIGAMKFW